MVGIPEGHIPAISIRQPWAELVIMGKKNIEIRSWSTEYRGKLRIHTGRTIDSNLEQSFHFSGLFHGGYLGMVDLEEVIPFEENIWYRWKSMHLDKGIYRPGLYAWILSNPVRLREPIPGPGELRLYLVSTETEDQLKQALPTTH